MVFDLRKKYNFSTRVPALLGGSYYSAQVEAILSADEAIRTVDIMTLHEQVKANIAINTIAKDCTWIKFKLVDGSYKILALEYIDLNSVKEVSTIHVNISLHGISTEDIAIIESRLRELGYKDYTVTYL